MREEAPTDDILAGHQALTCIEALPNFKPFKDGEDGNSTIIPRTAKGAKHRSHMDFPGRTL